MLCYDSLLCTGYLQNLSENENLVTRKCCILVLQLSHKLSALQHNGTTTVEFVAFVIGQVLIEFVPIDK